MIVCVGPHRLQAFLYFPKSHQSLWISQWDVNCLDVPGSKAALQMQWQWLEKQQERKAAGVPSHSEQAGDGLGAIEEG